MLSVNTEEDSVKNQKKKKGGAGGLGMRNVMGDIFETIIISDVHNQHERLLMKSL